MWPLLAGAVAAGAGGGLGAALAGPYQLRVHPRWFALAGALVTAAAVWLQPAVSVAVIAVAATTCALVDLATHRIPTPVVYPALALTLVVITVEALVAHQPARVGRALLGALIYGAVAWTLARLGAMGLGDVRLALLLGSGGATLGYAQLIVVMVGGFVAGGIIALVLLASGRVGRQDRIAFAPAMAVGYLVALAV